MLMGKLTKVIRQMQGKENIFGYKSTAANQLYLLYCISGKIYFSDKVDASVKYLWFVINLCGILVSYTTGLACLMYDKNQDVRKLLDISNAMGMSIDIGVVFPAILYYYRKDVENMIQVIDDISQTMTVEAQKHLIKVQKVITSNFFTAYVLMFIDSFPCILDVVLFYEEEKIKNYKYYPFPLPNVEEIGSARLFAANCPLLVFASPLYWLQWIAGVTMISLWGAMCHNEMIQFSDRFEYKMNTLKNVRNGGRTSQRWDRDFERVLIQDVNTFRNIKKAIDHFRGLAQILCTFTIPVNFLIQVATLYLITSTDMPLPVRLKGISFFLGAFWPMSLLYWVGEILENAVSAVSFSIYCSPWYRSVMVRKDVQIFLSQTQKSENLFMCKVYPLLLRNYSRLVHSVLSSVNILRRLTLKH